VNRKVLTAGLILVIPLLYVFFQSLGRDPREIRSPLIGHPAPPIALPPLGGGETVSLEALRGRPIVVNFWSTWCVPCFEEHAALQHSARRLKGQVRFVGVLYEDEEPNALEYLKRYGAAYPTLRDDQGRTAIAYGVTGVPETFIIDAQGTVVEKCAFPLTEEALDGLLVRARQPAATGGRAQ
jgi:cytochrome c biogenesis protein CcmG, thiol:disulfide interchange protein DsbE